MIVVIFKPKMKQIRHHYQCGAQEPCVSEQHMERILCDIESWQMGAGDQYSTHNSQTRKRCYRIFSQHINGHIGKGVRAELPSCVVEKVREALQIGQCTVMQR